MPSLRPPVLRHPPSAVLRILAALLLGGVPLLTPEPAHAQIRRCTAADGTSVFTDRRCEDLGSVSRRPHTAAAGLGRPASYRPRCMRSVDELVFEMGLAFDNQDANRLAGLYHWTGMSSSSGYAVAERLDRLVHRPLVGIVPVMPEPITPEPTPTSLPATETGDAAAPAALPASGDWSDWGRPLPPTPEPTPPARTDARSPTPSPSAAAAPPRRPVALRVEQTLSNGSTPSSTVFGLTRHFGCWWIRD